MYNLDYIVREVVKDRSILLDQVEWPLEVAVEPLLKLVQGIGLQLTEQELIDFLVEAEASDHLGHGL